MSPAQYLMAQVCFTASALVLTARVGWWLATEQAETPLLYRTLLSCLLLGLLGALWVESVSWSQRLKVQNQLTLRIVFSDSSVLTSARKRTISLEFQRLKDYLVGLGFDVPDVVPPIQINIVGGIMSSASPYGFSLGFTDKSIDDKTTLRNTYAFYVFSGLLKTFKTDVAAEPNRWAATMVIAAYFVDSYSDRYSGGREWNAALWKLRQELGQNFVDHALFYTVQLFDEKANNSKNDWNTFFRDRLERGMLVMENPGRRWKPKLDAVVREYNLTPSVPSTEMR